MSSAIVWFRNDLRLDDNSALNEAVKAGYEVLAVYIYDESVEFEGVMGSASRWWLHHSLSRLKDALRKKGGDLYVFQGKPLECLQDLTQEHDVTSLYWNRRYDPRAVCCDKEIKSHFEVSGVDVRTFNGHLLHEPWTVKTGQGTPFKVFTPFWKKAQSLEVPSRPRSCPKTIPFVSDHIAGASSIDDLQLLPHLDWDAEFYHQWEPGEKGARKLLDHFVTSDMAMKYNEERDFPGHQGTSRLSAHLHFGEISIRELWHTLNTRKAKCSAQERKNIEGWIRQLYWRDFAHSMIFYFPDTALKPLRPEFEEFPWVKNKKHLKAWQKGLTGYPIVDAGMRELWVTGWMHNRVRMIVGSFLTKDLMLHWKEGADWFWDTLVDADLANNTFGWQWVGGCGADASPYFRIFNPITQSKKFDSKGEYIKKWIPELSRLDPKWIHAPWEAPEEALASANLQLGKDYPQPIVDHSEARKAALHAYERMKK